MKIKNFAIMAAVALTTLASCGNKEGNNAGAPTTADSLHVALANQDSLLVILNDITEGMNQIKQMENILATGGLGAETPSKRQEIRNDMEQIQQALEQKAINNLKAQIANQQETIDGLRNQLADANVKIEGLNRTVTDLGQKTDSLKTVAVEENTARQEAERRAAELNNEMNICYYAIGTGKELKAHNLMQSGFLRKTKVMPSNFDQSYFTTGDKRSLRTINLGSKKAKVMTNQPEDSYEIVEAANGMKVLKITNPTRFWNQSNFLIVKTD